MAKSEQSKKETKPRIDPALKEESTEALLGEAEPWERWETAFMAWSIGLAIVGLIVLGILINIFILN